MFRARPTNGIGAEGGDSHGEAAHQHGQCEQVSPSRAGPRRRLQQAGEAESLLVGATQGELHQPGQRRDRGRAPRDAPQPAPKDVQPWQRGQQPTREHHQPGGQEQPEVADGLDRTQGTAHT